MREPDRIIRLKTVLARTGLSRSTIYRKIAEGTFPAQLKISSNGTGWHESEVSRWIADPVDGEPTIDFPPARTRGSSSRTTRNSWRRVKFRTWGCPRPCPYRTCPSEASGLPSSAIEKR
ncbi:AlpA family transcriptional regulator [Bradyrhizobium sp. 81013]|nr:AlpA family transcriptional regulator [Bradyrhizobium aeschynomenes]